MKDAPLIAINATFMHENPTGLGRYTYEVVKALLEIECDFDFTIYSSSSELKRLFPDKVMSVSSITSPSLGYKGHLMRLLWLQTILPFKLKKQRASLFYSPVAEGILNPPLKQVITIYDFIHLKFPEMYSQKKYYYYYNYTLPIILRNSQAIVCISENTKKDLLSFYGIKDKPIYVIYEGFDKQRFYPRDKGVMYKRYGLKKYLLYIGDLKPYKNLERSLEAFAMLGLKDYIFVIGGRKDPRYYPRIKSKVEELSLQDRVLFLGYVHEEDLPHLYSEAEAFIFPSLYEGFGLPPLEAMACGCPVLTSNVASLPEVCGDAAFYVDPYNTEAIAEGMYKILTDEKLKKELIRKGLERVKLFSWKNAAMQLIKVFEEVSDS